MERLTVDTDIVFCDIAKCADIPGGSFCEDGYCDQRRVYERLRAYERTGMSPDDIENMKHVYFETVVERDKLERDAVPMVRCRDCKYWGDEDGFEALTDGLIAGRCNAHNHMINGRHVGWCPKENDFCSYGERRGDNDL